MPVGIRYMALAAFFFSLMSVLVKVAGRSIPTMELVFARALVVAVIAGAVIRHRRIEVRTDERPLLVLRGVMGFAALTCFYYAVIHLPLAEVTVIHYTNPVFTALIAAATLGEVLRRRELALAVTSLVGVAVVVRPSFLFGAGGAGQESSAVVAALGAAVFSAAAYVLVRRLRRQEHLVVVLYFAVVSAVLAFPLMLVSAVPPRGWDWPVLAGVGVSTYLGQVFLTRGLQRERAGRATAVGYLQIIFAAMWGVAFFGEIPDVFTLVGAAIIVGSTVALARLRSEEPTPATEPSP